MLKKGWMKTEKEINEFCEKNEEIQNQGAYKNLMLQANKLAKHAKGVGITTQRQYYHHFDQFIRFAADRFNLKKIANISNKHLAVYIEERQSSGYSAGTIKNDLAAVRYFHDQIPKAKHRLYDNKKLGQTFNLSLERRVFVGVNRRWSELEYQKMLNLANELQHPKTAQILELAREQGFIRIHEAVRLSRTDAERAIATGVLRVKGKGGLIRSVPVRETTKSLLQNCMKEVQRGKKLFVPENKKAHQVIQSVQDFIQNHRGKVTDPTARESGIPLTIHGLRHAYSKEEFDRFIENRMEPKEARYQVSLLIGHSREDVTKIYLAE